MAHVDATARKRLVLALPVVAGCGGGVARVGLRVPTRGRPAL